jgi:hypothetical protein
MINHSFSNIILFFLLISIFYILACRKISAILAVLIRLSLAPKTP